MKQTFLMGCVLVMSLCVLTANLSCTAQSDSSADSTQEIVKSPFVFSKNDFENEEDWTQNYLERVYAELVRMMNNPDVEPPVGIKIVLEKDPESPGVSGFAMHDTIGFQANSWEREKFRLWILTHELCNLFANRYADTGGFPSDWWSNGRSPFPVYVSTLVCEKLGENATAEWLRTVDTEKPDQRLYWALHRKYGFELFAGFFRLVRSDDIDFGNLGTADWPSADECRSAYAIAYLSLVADENLAAIFRDHDIGKKPEDWDGRHPDRPFSEYSISDKQIADLIARRNELFGENADAQHKTELERRKKDFRQGIN